MKNVGFGAYFCCNGCLNEKSVAILSQNGSHFEESILQKAPGYRNSQIYEHIQKRLI